MIALDIKHVDLGVYVEQLNGDQVIYKLAINSDKELKDVTLSITSSCPEFLIPFVMELPTIPANTPFEVKEAKSVKFNSNFLGTLEDKYISEMIVTLTSAEGNLLFSKAYTISAMPYNFLRFTEGARKLIAAFSTPNHHLVPLLKKRASEIMKEDIGSDSLSAYQRNDPNHVLQCVSAIFSAFQERGISYSVSSSTTNGQYIRMLHHILRENAEEANCVHFSLALCSVLEACGYHCGLVITDTHCFAYVFLKNTHFPNSVITSVDEIRKRLPTNLGSKNLANGDLVVIECTFISGSSGATLEDAMQSAEKMVDQMKYLVDISAARDENISTIETNFDQGIYTVSEEHNIIDHALPDELEHVDTDAPISFKYGKLDQWNRYLLSKDKKNPLMNLAFGKGHSIPLYSAGLSALLSELCSKGEFDVLSLQASRSATSADSYETLSKIFISSETSMHLSRVLSPLKEREVHDNLRYLHENTKTSIQERGVNPLYIAAGFMRWYDSAVSTTAYYAPILLFPAELSYKSNEYKLHVRDDAAHLNAPLIELIRQEFKTDVPVWNELPRDEHNRIDIPRILASMRAAVKNLRRWDVVTAVALGSFGFSDLEMWQDINRYPHVFEQNPLTASLIHGRQLAETKNVFSELKDEIPRPISLDASQLAVVEEAAKGTSFVVHGPPGTGKSQCSAAVIADSMKNDKNVAFVTEKQAAIQVVYSRLEELGLGSYCLDLHSPNTKKEMFLEALEKIINLATPIPEDVDDCEDMVSRWKNIRSTIDNYGKILHTPTPSGMSLFEMINSYEELNTQPCSYNPDPDLLPPVEALTMANLADQRETLERMANLVSIIGSPDKHALRDLNTPENSRHFKQKFSALANTYKSCLQDFRSTLNDFLQVAELPPAEKYPDILEVAELAISLTALRKTPPCWLTENGMEHIENIRELSEAQLACRHIQKYVLEVWEEDILCADEEKLLSSYNIFEKIANTFPSLSNWSFDRMYKNLRPYMKDPSIDTDQIGYNLELLQTYNLSQDRADDLMDRYHNLVIESFMNIPTEWNAVLTYCDSTANAIKCVAESPLVHTTVQEALATYPAETAIALAKAWSSLQHARKDFYNLLKKQPRILGEDWITEEENFCDATDEQISQSKDWFTFRSLCNHLARDHGLYILEAEYMNGNDPETVNRGYFKAVYQKLINLTMDSDPILKNSGAEHFDYNIKNLQYFEKELRDFATKDISNTVLHRIHILLEECAHENSDLCGLRRVISSRGLGMTIRTIMSKYFHLIRKLCPCILLSPSSMAQYLPMGDDLFDLLIMDESSQIPTARAIGSMVRCKQAIVIGDSKQMPPSNFFDSKDYVENSVETEDLSCILDDLLVVSMPSTYLNVHYRSQHDSLINFSNNHFYDNKLLTFPSARDRKSHVHFRYVPDGVYDHGTTRTNPKEAVAIIRYLAEHSRDPERKNQSVGIITFNIQQRECLEKLLLEAATTDTVLSAWLANLKEPIFVKNLENAQGDERDVILFSVNFAPDKDGNFSMNFGPINKDGGWRRLNVAITRARCAMYVFCSFPPEAIDLSRTASRGVQELKNFLEYANGKSVTTGASATLRNKATNRITGSICDILKEHGYETVTDVGTSSETRLDIGVVDPKNPCAYILGIQLDGESYKATSRTQDRELSHPDMLRNLGWNLHRIWSVEWFDHKPKEIKKLLARLESLT